MNPPNWRLEDASSNGRLRAVSASSSLELENIEDSDEGLLLRGEPGRPWSLSSALPTPTQPSPVEDRSLPSPRSPPSPFPIPSPFLSPSPLQSTALNQPTNSAHSHILESRPSGSTYSQFEVDFPGSGVGYDSTAITQGPLCGDWRPM